uniref:Uncharacterized protein n=1 Tax=viral metagenome TaxID=1070528 RepID=A0A6C0K3X6_9ZZZZ
MSGIQMRVLHTCQTHLLWLFEAGFTAWYDVNPAWTYMLETHPASEEITNKTLMFCSDATTYKMGRSKGVEYFLTLFPVAEEDGRSFHPVHRGLWISQPRLKCLDTFALSFYDFPAIEYEHICFNGSKLDDFICIRVSKEKWGESMIIAVDANNTQRIKILNPAVAGSTIFEDSRLFLYKGEIWSTFTIIENYTTGVPTKQWLGYCSVYPDFGMHIMPKYGKNLEMGPEKNWGFFQEGGDLFAIYSYRPWTILKIEQDEATKVYEQEFSAEYKGRIHGGTSPKMVDGVWWAFGRSMTYMGYPSIIVVAFEPRTFRILRVFEPSFLSREALGMNLFYIGSAEYADGIWTCVGGWNDAKVCKIVFPHAAVIGETPTNKI